MFGKFTGLGLYLVEREAGIQVVIKLLVFGEYSGLVLYLVWEVRLAYRAVSSLWSLVSRSG